MSQWLFDATLHVNPSDSSLHVVAYAHDGRVASKRFPPSISLALREWLQSSTTWAEAQIVAKSASAFVSYRHDDGQLVLTGHRLDRSFDVSNDEDMAKFVRLLKKLAPLPKETEPLIPNLLPKPTPEQLAAATRYLRPMVAKGSGSSGGGSRSGALSPQPASYLKSKEKLATLMAKLKAPA